jgi:hypothetical protein
VSVARFVATQRVQSGIPHATACRALGVSQAWFYKWQHGDASPRRARRRQLEIKIAQLFAQHKRRYGSPRIVADLREDGWRVSVNTVAQIMAEQGLRARSKRRRNGGTRPGRAQWRAPDLVGRQFGAATVNAKWYGDGTEILTDEGKLYLLVTWNLAAWLRPTRRRYDEHEEGAAEVAGVGPARARRRMAAGVGGHGPGTSHDRCEGAGRVPAFV